MPRCLLCNAVRNTPCKPAGCRAFSDKTIDQIEKQRIIQAKHQLAALEPKATK